MNGAVINLMILIPFLIFAIFLSKGKGAFLLAGYNTMSDSEKANYDEAALCKFMGKIMFGVSFSLGLFALSEWLEKSFLFVTGLISLSFFIVFGVVYSNTGNRFKKNV